MFKATTLTAAIALLSLQASSASASTPIVDVDSLAPAPQPYCFTPITAVVCVGVVILSAAVSNCAHTSNICPVDPEPEVPGGAGGVPEEGGDGDSGKGGEGSGGDED